MDPTIIVALIGAGVGTIGVRIIEHILNRSTVKIDQESKMREELRSQIDDLREETGKLEDGRDKWREQYYSLRDKYVELQTQLTMALEKLETVQQALDKELRGPVE